MTLSVSIPGGEQLEIDHLVLDVNGTLTTRGELVDGVGERLAAIVQVLEVHLLSADTFGVLGQVANALGVRATNVGHGEEKARYLQQLGAGRCAAIGNGENDRAMLEAAALGIAVLGPEGTGASALQAARLVCPTILDALDVLLDPRALAATLRP